MSTRAASAPRSTVPRDAADGRLRHEVGRVGEAVEKVAALEIRSERLDDLAVRRRVGHRRRRRTPPPVPRRRARSSSCARDPAVPPGSDRGRLWLAAGDGGPECRRRPGRCSSGSRECRRGSRRRCGGETATSTSVEPPAAVGTPQNVKRFESHADRPVVRAPPCSCHRWRRGGRIRCPASGVPRSSFEPCDRVIGAHLRSVTAQGRQLPGDPLGHVDREGRRLRPRRRTHPARCPRSSNRAERRPWRVRLRRPRA